MNTDDHKTNHAPRSLLLAAMTFLAVLSGMVGVVRKAAQLSPQVGDVVAFDPAHATVFESAARLIAERSRKESCILDVSVIQRSGGSLVVEQRGVEPDRLYRAHWAGPRTSDDTSDCGSEADLVLTRIDINTLATAGGGFGVEHAPVPSLR